MQVTGLQKAILAVKLLNPETRSRLKAVVGYSGRQMVSVAKANVHVDSGELRDTIRVDFSADGMSAFPKVGYGSLKRGRRRGKGTSTRTRRRRRAQLLGPVEPGIYAMVVEFGSKTRPAHPFFFPALESITPGHIKRANDALKGAVDAAAAKAGAK